MDKIVQLKPKIVVYGISYRDFKTDLDSETSVLSLKELFHGIAFEINPTSINPKLVTRKALGNIWNEQGEISGNTVHDQFTPFFKYDEGQSQIQSSEILEQRKGNTDAVSIFVPTSNSNKQLFYFKKIINKLIENDIKVIVFTTPMHKIYLDDLPKSSRNNFALIVEDFTKNRDIIFYNYTSKYDELSIWSDHSHIAYNVTSDIYTRDIAQIMLNRMEP